METYVPFLVLGAGLLGSLPPAFNCQEVVFPIGGTAFLSGVTEQFSLLLA